NTVATFATNSFFFTGPITLTGANSFTANTSVFLAGVVSGTGSLNLLAGNSLVVQNPNNTYSGGTNVGGSGQLQVTTSDVLNSNGVLVSGPLGTGPVNLTGGVLQNANTTATSAGQNQYTGAAITLHNAVNLINANFIIGAGNALGGGDINLAGPVNI